MKAGRRETGKGNLGGGTRDGKEGWGGRKGKGKGEYGEEACYGGLIIRINNNNNSLAVDTGAAVNVISEEAYKALKRNSRGGSRIPRPSDLNLFWCHSFNLKYFGHSLLADSDVEGYNTAYQNRFLCDYQL